MTGDIEAIGETGAAAAIEIAASALADRGAKPGACANCGNPLLGPYCAVCGQPVDSHRRSVHGLLHDFFVDLVNFDSRILRTARALLFQPGELPAAFREGRTQPYVPAIRLYFFVSLIFFVLLGVTGIALIQVQVVANPVKVIWDAKGNAFETNPDFNAEIGKDPEAKDVVKPLIAISRKKATRPGGLFNYTTVTQFFARIGTLHSTLSPAARRQLLENDTVKIEGPGKATSDYVQRKLYETVNRIAADPAALNEPLTNWMPRVLFLLLPLYALLLALFHVLRRKDFYLVDHLVFSLSIHTFAFVALMATAGLAQALPGDMLVMAFFAVIALYIFLAMKRFYRQGWFLTGVKFVIVSGIYFVFFLLPALVGVLALSVFGGSLG
ncbi:MAG TPA: DUF3667 domain-containing protein [Rhizomicrobium sp.]